jgi:hypothetical protein
LAEAQINFEPSGHQATGLVHGLEGGCPDRGYFSAGADMLRQSG